MRISAKLIIATTVLSLITVIATGTLVGLVAFSQGKSGSEEKIHAQLLFLRDNKALQVQNYLEGLSNQLIAFSNNLTVIHGLKEFTRAYPLYLSELKQNNAEHYRASVLNHYVEEFSDTYVRYNGGDQYDAKPLINVLDETSFALQYHYILRNPNPVEEKAKLNAAQDGTTYSKVHARFHPFMRAYLQRFKLYDIFLIDGKTGKVVYSTSKELDFTTSLKDGPYANTGLGRVFEKANAATSNNFIAISDFEPYLPSYNRSEAFLATAIFDESYQAQGVLVFQIPASQINDIMTSNQRWQQIGLGATGETYLINEDGTMRSESRFLMENPHAYFTELKSLKYDPNIIKMMEAKLTDVGLQKITTQAATDIAQGKSGYGVYRDYRNHKVLGAYAPLQFKGLDWGIIAEIDHDEGFASVNTVASSIFKYTIIIMVVMTTIATVLGALLAMQVSMPIEKFCALIRELAITRDLTKRFRINTQDEMGEMAKSLNDLLASLQTHMQETIMASEKVRDSAERLVHQAEDYQTDEFSDSVLSDFDIAEHDSMLKDTEDHLAQLSDKLTDLSKQFKIFEEEADRRSDW